MAPTHSPGAGDRRIAFVEAAVPVFNRFGFRRASLTDLTAGAQTTGTSVYRHFASKEDLLAEVVRYGTASVRELVEATLAGTQSPDAKLRKFQVGLASLSVEKRAYGAVIHREIRNLDDPVAKDLRGDWHAIVGVLAELLAELRPEWSIWDAELMARVQFAIAASPSYTRKLRVPATKQRKITLRALQAATSSDCLVPQQRRPAPAVRDVAAFREHATTRAAILSCATRLFGECGFHNTGLEDIAEAAGVTVPTVYAYFKDKAALLIAGQLPGTGWLQASITNALSADTSSRERLLMAVRSYAEFGVRNTSLVAVLSHELQDIPDEETGRFGQKSYIGDLAGLLRADRPGIDASHASALVRAALGVVNEITRTRRYLGRPTLIDELAGLSARVIGS
ncbi:TetR family transcriptional regulator [Antricoccus suffuscus]|uniref:TetR family transcriptional regulator n=1 Tax=Antricoccus suffuscus TaxID=1629062 RepID=A0A2T0ZEN6_9ACTN|nr:TetR/AcrR family transcriptional regulator [Antricoccus suffuscus]PRZ34771.1 TetR family transcriptional regulator [Antricoccus suffuscus]